MTHGQISRTRNLDRLPSALSPQTEHNCSVF